MKSDFNDYEIANNSFSYLMYLLYKNKSFSELHLPSLNLVKRDGKTVVIKKIIPIEFKKRVEEIKKTLENSRKTNIQIKKEFIGNDIRLVVHSRLGQLCEAKKLTNNEKKNIIKLFFGYHREINNKKIEINTSYHHFFNKKKFVEDTLTLKNKIYQKKESSFDRKVLGYLELISQQKICLDYSYFEECNVHGDFTLKNIIKNSNCFSLIDLDMLHKGYLEVQLIILLNELFGFATKEFFENLKYCYKSFLLNKRSKTKLFETYLVHKILDLSLIKTAYFTNRTKYLELQTCIKSQMKFITDLIHRKEEFLRVFNQNLRD